MSSSPPGPLLGKSSSSFGMHPAATSKPRRSRSLYYGWVLMATLGITTIISYGTTEYLFGVLVVPLTSAFHWSRASLSGAYALGLILSGVLGVLIGYAVDRWGARWLMTGGSALAGLVFIALSQVQTLVAILCPLVGWASAWRWHSRCIRFLLRSPHSGLCSDVEWHSPS